MKPHWVWTDEKQPSTGGRTLWTFYPFLFTRDMGSGWSPFTLIASRPKLRSVDDPEPIGFWSESGGFTVGLPFCRVNLWIGCGATAWAQRWARKRRALRLAREAIR